MNEVCTFQTLNHIGINEISHLIWQILLLLHKLIDFAWFCHFCLDNMSLAIFDAMIPIFLFMIVQNTESLNPTTSRLMCLMHPVGFPSTFYRTRHFNKHLHEFQPLLVVGSGHENLALLKGKRFGNISTMGRTETSAPLRKVHSLQNGLRLVQIQTHLKGFGISNQHLKSCWTNSMQHFAHESWQEVQNIQTFSQTNIEYEN